MTIDTPAAKSWLIAFGLNVVIILTLGITSYFFTQTIEQVVTYTVLTGCIITAVWSYVIFPGKFWSLPYGIMFQKTIIVMMLCIIMILLCFGVTLTGKKLQQRHHPESFVPL